MVSRWKGETGSALPLITCVTDLSSHSEWIHKYTDCYLVGSNDIRSRLAAKGVDRDIICVTGIPVRCEFKRPVRRRPGRERNLLIMGGGLGLLPKRMAAWAEKAFYGTCDKYLSKNPDGSLQLDGICLVAGLGGKDHRDGSLAYYFSEPVVCNDAKGVGPLVLAYTEMIARK